MEMSVFLNDSGLAAQEKSLKRGEILYHEGDEARSLYVVKKGLIGLFHISESGKESFLRVFAEGDVLGHRSFFAEEAYHATSISLTDTRVNIVSTTQCQELCEKNSDFLKEVTKSLAKDLRRAELRLAGLTDKSADQRIAESLVFLKHKYPEQVWTRREIAEFSGSTIETVTRSMSKLEEEGVLKKKGRDFEILNLKALLTR